MKTNNNKEAETLTAQEARPGSIADNPNEVDRVVVRNTHLLKSVGTDPGLSQKYTALMEKASALLNSSITLTYKEKKEIATELNSEVAAAVIIRWGENAADVIYSGICMEKGGDPYQHSIYHPESHPYVYEIFKVQNSHLMGRIEGLPYLERKYNTAQDSLSKEIFYGRITYSDKRRIVDTLNSKAGANLIAQYAEQVRVIVFAGLCVAGGSESILDKYSIPTEVRTQSVAISRELGLL